MKENSLLEQEVKEVLLQDASQIPLENINNESFSPLNQPVKEKDIAGTDFDNLHTEIPNPVSDSSDTQTRDFREEATEAYYRDIEAQSPLDAPEQQIHARAEASGTKDTGEEFEVPIAQAKQAADAVLGIANNFMEIGGGFFVKIRKHKEFYDFEEIIQVIDDQNQRNVEKILLTEEDKALLRPLLMSILQTKAKKLTPTQQLMGAVVSIMVKKFQIVLEIRAENEILTERILDIIRDEKRATTSPAPTEATPQNEPESPKPNSMTSEPAVAPMMSAAVLEVADDNRKTGS